MAFGIELFAFREAIMHKEKDVTEVMKSDGLPGFYFKSPEIERSGRLIAEQVESEIRKLSVSVEIHPEIRGGIPVLRGTRMPISRILAEIAENSRISEIAEDYELDNKRIADFVEGLAILFDRSVLK
ncbi:MAG: hypothetical protein DRI57_28995 [Deltaproteobacteria bacterium]|nr:MAG: hypothetical protein DRI57_28995 [Deltaproteobacteria bacterium]